MTRKRFRCQHCGRYTDREDIHQLVGGKTVCPACWLLYDHLSYRRQQAFRALDKRQ